MDATDYDYIEQSATIDGLPATVRVSFSKGGWSRTYCSLDTPHVIDDDDGCRDGCGCDYAVDEVDDPESEEEEMARLLSEGSLGGVISDPDDGRPAVTEYRSDDSLESIEHWCDGRINDPEDGGPAVIRYRPDGSIREVEHRCSGSIHDPEDGNPARIVYWEDGSIALAEHYQTGRLHDPDGKTPARVEYWPDGTLLVAEHFYEGDPFEPAPAEPRAETSGPATPADPTQPESESEWLDPMQPTPEWLAAILGRPSEGGWILGEDMGVDESGLRWYGACPEEDEIDGEPWSWSYYFVRDAVADVEDGEPTAEVRYRADGSVETVERTVRYTDLTQGTAGRGRRTQATTWHRPDGTVEAIEQYVNGKLHDPADGRAALMYLAADGSVEGEEHYHHGLVRDAPDGGPGVVSYYPDGKPKVEEHYRDGLLHDSYDGRPAVVRYRPDGSIEAEEHYHYGQPSLASRPSHTGGEN